MSDAKQRNRDECLVNQPRIDRIAWHCHAKFTNRFGKMVWWGAPEAQVSVSMIGAEQSKPSGLLQVPGTGSFALVSVIR